MSIRPAHLGLLLLSVLGCKHTAALDPEPPVAQAPDDPTLSALSASIAASGTDAWDMLATFCDTFGPRPAGSVALEQSTAWAEAELSRAGLKAWREPVTVPVWRRGEAKLELVSPRIGDGVGPDAPGRRELSVMALGGSVAANAVEAPIVVVNNTAELGPHVAGHIVVFNKKMQVESPAILGYGPAVEHRVNGAIEAARHGAVAVLVRSVTTRSLYTLHTGGVRYDPAVPAIPAAAITVEDADWLQRITRSDREVRLRLNLSTSRLPDQTSHNVLAEIPGKSHEIVLIGAHIDSWDVGQGAHDDGAGVVEVMMAMMHLHRLSVTPDATIRAVLFTNEEWGLSGGKAYAELHGAEPHRVAVETDLGGGAPIGWVMQGRPEAVRWLEQRLLPLGLPTVREGGGADIGPLAELGVLVAGLQPDDSRYFDVHHTHADTVDKVDPDALRAGVAAMAGFAWRAATGPASHPR